MAIIVVRESQSINFFITSSPYFFIQGFYYIFDKLLHFYTYGIGKLFYSNNQTTNLLARFIIITTPIVITPIAAAASTFPYSLNSIKALIVKVVPDSSIDKRPDALLTGILTNVPTVNNSAADSETMRPVESRIATKIPDSEFGITTLDTVSNLVAPKLADASRYESGIWESAFSVCVMIKGINIAVRVAAPAIIEIPKPIMRTKISMPNKP